MKWITRERVKIDRVVCPWLIRLAVCVVLAWPTTAQAHKDDYIDETLVYLTLQRGEVEPEYWLDYGRRTDEGVNFFRHNFSLEYGITDHLMIDSRATWLDDLGDAFTFDSARAEIRYRFFDEGTLPVDIAISGEVNTERRGDGQDRGPQEVGLEPRLILSRDFGELNLTLNLAEEIVPQTGETAFNMSFGVRYNLSEQWRVGSELKYDFDSHEGSFIPQVWYQLSEDVALKFGFSAGFDQNKENFVRIAIEIGF